MISQDKKTLRLEVANRFKHIAQSGGDSPQQKSIDENLQDFLTDEPKQKRAAIVQSCSIGDIYVLTSLFESIQKSIGDDVKIYFVTKPEYFCILSGNPYIHRCIPFHEQFENHFWMTSKYFQYCFIPSIGTQKVINYVHSGEDKLYDGFIKQIKES